MNRVTYFHSRQGMVQVKRGFSWPAFFFGSLWAAANRLWIPVFRLTLVAEALLWVIDGLAAAHRRQGLALAAAAAWLPALWRRR